MKGAYLLRGGQQDWRHCGDGVLDEMIELGRANIEDLVTERADRAALWNHVKQARGRACWRDYTLMLYRAATALRHDVVMLNSRNRTCGLARVRSRVPFEEALADLDSPTGDGFDATVDDTLAAWWSLTWAPPPVALSLVAENTCLTARWRSTAEAVTARHPSRLVESRTSWTHRHVESHRLARPSRRPGVHPRTSHRTLHRR